MAGNAEPVHRMFSAIARRYDLLNRLMTLGLDQRWRRALAELAVQGVNSAWAPAPEPALEGQQAGAPAATRSVDPARGLPMGSPYLKILDCACGTGDVAFAIADAMQRARCNGTVTGVDFSAEMISLAQRKLGQRTGDATGDASRSIAFVQADVMALPYSDGTFDACTIAFGLRNLPDMHKGVHELLRVVRPGGALCILETGQPPPGLWRLAARLYASTLMPLLGLLISGHWRAYRYLYTTSWRFPSGTGLAALIDADPLAAEVDWWPLAGGVAYLYRVRRRALP